MRFVLEGSFIYCLAARIYGAFKKCYSESILCRFFAAVRLIYSKSLLCRLVENYLARESKIRFSMLYRLLAFVGTGLDAIAGKINSTIVQSYNESLLKKSLGLFGSAGQGRVHPAALYILLPFAAGYALTCVLAGAWSLKSFILLLIILLACGVFSLWPGRLKTWGNESLFCKLLRYIWE